MNRALLSKVRLESLQGGLEAATRPAERVCEGLSDSVAMARYEALVERFSETLSVNDAQVMARLVVTGRVVWGSEEVVARAVERAMAALQTLYRALGTQL